MQNFFTNIKNYIYSEFYNIKKNHKVKLFTLLLIVIFFPISIPVLIISFTSGLMLALMPGKRKYDKSIYKIITQKSYLSILFDKGKMAEYFTWDILNNQPEYKKVLINIYIPNGNHTNEIDSILINNYGVFVIESKGYSGWIFGNETNKTWTQIIYKHRTHFFNPIIQNRIHIESLAKILEINNPNIFRSYIVFSERCELKKIYISKPNLKVIKRHQLQDTLNNDYKKYGKVLNNSEITNIYDKLVNYMFCSDNVKNKHIKYINSIKE